MNEHMNEDVHYCVITTTGVLPVVDLDRIPMPWINLDATKEDIQSMMEGGTFTATMDKESAKRFIRILFPNNWLKMHGFTKRRKGESR